MKNVKILLVFALVFSLFLLLGKVSADSGLGSGFDGELIPKGNTPDSIASILKNIWGSVALILQVASLAGVIYAGVRYMFASSDARADIKQGLFSIIIGCVLVFGATTVVNYIVGVVEQIDTLKPTDESTKTPKDTNNNNIEQIN